MKLKGFLWWELIMWGVQIAFIGLVGVLTWLVIIGASLFAAFPAVYAVFLGAFYIPVLLMLFGLRFR